MIIGIFSIRIGRYYKFNEDGEPQLDDSSNNGGLFYGDSTQWYNSVVPSKIRAIQTKARQSRHSIVSLDVPSFIYDNIISGHYLINDICFNGLTVKCVDSDADKVESIQKIDFKDADGTVVGELFVVDIDTHPAFVNHRTVGNDTYIW